MGSQLKIKGEILPLYIADSDTARLLGHDMRWFRANVATLEATTGFPKIDTVIGHRHREAVEEWARARNMRPRPVSDAPVNRHKENKNAL